MLKREKRKKLELHFTLVYSAILNSGPYYRTTYSILLVFTTQKKKLNKNNKKKNYRVGTQNKTEKYRKQYKKFKRRNNSENKNVVKLCSNSCNMYIFAGVVVRIIAKIPLFGNNGGKATTRTST